MSEHFPACVRPLNSVKSRVFGEPPSWIWMLIRPWGRVCYNPWCNVLRKALVSTVTERSLKGRFEDFEDVWKPKNLDLLTLQEIVSIKYHKASGLRVKMVFLMICTPMIFTSITKLDLGRFGSTFVSLGSFFLSISASLHCNRNLNLKQFKACHSGRSERVFLLWSVAIRVQREHKLMIWF